MVTSRKKSLQNPIRLQNKCPHLRRALNLLDSQLMRDRMMGYALVTTCFHLCPEEVRKYVHLRWKKEEKVRGLKKEFVEYCAKKFEK